MIPHNTMRTIYDALRTPYKRGAVIQSDDYFCDSPVVFRHRNRWYMTYVRIDKTCTRGYETHLAVSDDLLRWTLIGKILDGHNIWDCAQTGGYAQFIDCTFGGTNEITPIGGSYRFAYIGGSKCGYETDPLAIGMAATTGITDLSAYHKHPEPILAPSDTDARRGETRTLYKPNMFVDVDCTLGHRYVCAYNAKDETDRESIFLAVSDNGIDWQRYGEKAIIPVWDCDDDVRINGDPQIIRMDGHYVMLYFRYDAKGAYNTFAVSDDLIHWTKWSGDALIRSTEPWEDVYAHKPWVLSYHGVVYHYYCAVNSKGERFIALATSKT